MNITNDKKCIECIEKSIQLIKSSIENAKINNFKSCNEELKQSAEIIQKSKEYMLNKGNKGFNTNIDLYMSDKISQAISYYDAYIMIMKVYRYHYGTFQ